MKGLVRWQHTAKLLPLLFTIAHLHGQGTAALAGDSVVAASLRALELDSTFVPAAEALALAPIRHDGGAQLDRRVAMLRRVRGLLAPPFLYAAALVERETGHPDSATALWRQLLDGRVVDRGLVEIAMARDLFASGHANEGYVRLLDGASDSSAPSERAYRWEIGLVASPAELAEWDSVPPPRRAAWLRDFWAVRDVRDGQRPGTRIVEHYHRLEEVFEQFRFTVPNALDARAAGLRNGIRPRYLGAAPAYSRSARTFDGDIDDHTADVIRMAGLELPPAAFRSDDDVIDDRGMVYMRYGLPTAAMRTVDSTGLELWKYDRPGTPLFVAFELSGPRGKHQVSQPFDVGVLSQLNDFDGEAAPGRLIPTVALEFGPINRFGYYQAGFCALKPSLCQGFPKPQLATNPLVNCKPAATELTLLWSDKLLSGAIGAATLEGRRIPPPGDAMFIHAREALEGSWADSVVSTTDANPPAFTRLIAPTIELHILDRANADGHRVVVAFAIAADQLAAPSRDAAGPIVYPIDVHLILHRASDGIRIDADTLALFGAPRILTKGQFLTGEVEVAVAPGNYRAALVFTQADGSGALVDLDSLVVPGETGTLRTSDLILGREGSGVTWTSGDMTVPLNPLHIYPRGSDADAYFQAAGLTAGTNYSTSFAFFHASDDSIHAPRLNITVPGRADQSRIEVMHTLGLRGLEPGGYRVQLTVRDAGQTARTSACLSVAKVSRAEGKPVPSISPNSQCAVRH